MELDPGFAPAWAELSLASSYLAYNTDPTPQRIEQARRALEQAVALAPDLPEVRLARAYFSYRCRRTSTAPSPSSTPLPGIFPNNAEVYKAFGLLLRRKGRLGDAIQALRHAEWLNPKTGELVWILAETQRALRNFKEADRGFAEAISQAPDEPFSWEQRALNRLAMTGDPEAARAVLAATDLSEDSLIKATEFRLDLYEGKYQQALDGLSPDWLSGLAPETEARVAMMAAVARERMGDHRGALSAAESNRVDLLDKIARYPGRGFLHVCLGVALAQLGRSGEALAEAQKAAQMGQIDSFSGPRIGEIQALIDVILGRHREATDRLIRLLATSYRNSLTMMDLRLDPAWEPLRQDPSFRALLR